MNHGATASNAADAAGRAAATPRLLLLPGWQNSGPTHWQSRWEVSNGPHCFCRVEQADWRWPRRGDWMARLDEVLLQSPTPAVLIAHSLGCQLVAAWAAHSRHTGRVLAALLVAPADTERADTPPQLFSWRPIVRTRLPFECRVVFSSNDPYCAAERAVAMADDWGGCSVGIGPSGDVNGESDLADWPAGLAMLQQMLDALEPAHDAGSAQAPCRGRAGQAPRLPGRRAGSITDNPPHGDTVVTKKLKGLGLGLEALLGPRVREARDVGADAADALPTTLKLDQLLPGRYQPRTRMDEGSLYELAESIKSQGVMQPILVRPVGPSADRRFEIIAGERRSRAARLAGLEEIPVLVRAVPDEAAAVMSLIENIQRENLNPLEEAQGLARLVNEFKLTHDQAAQAVGRSRSAASNLLRLLNLSQPVQVLLMAGDLDMGHARALLPLDGAQQVLCAHEIVARELSVRDTERLVARQSAGPPQPAMRAPRQKPADVLRIEQELSDSLTSPVEIRIKKRSRGVEQGEVAIGFGSMEELNGLLERLGLSSR